MRNLLDKYLPLRSPDDGGGSAAGGEGAGENGSAGGGTTAGEAAAGAESGGSNEAAAAAAAAAGQPYRPQGLPDTMFGKDDRETMDKMANALNGYRTRDAERALPDKVEAYAEFDAETAPDFLKPHLTGLAKDPTFAAAAKVAMENGVPVKTMHAMTSALYQAAHEAGVLEAPIDDAAERAALLPETLKTAPKADQDRAIDARLEANENFIKLLMKPGDDGKSQLDPKVGENALLMLMDTAAGNSFLEFVRANMTGENHAQPFGGGSGQGAGNSAREALKARLAAPEMQKGNAGFNQAAYDQLMADYQKAIPS